jgi:hypothetical protein
MRDTGMRNERELFGCAVKCAVTQSGYARFSTAAVSSAAVS